MLTKRGIELNIKESKYIYEIDNLVLYFSSVFNKERFVSGIDSFIKEETIKLQNKYKLKINLNTYLIVAFYIKIEKRGFYIVDKTNKKELENNTIFKLYENTIN